MRSSTNGPDSGTGVAGKLAQLMQQGGGRRFGQGKRDPQATRTGLSQRRSGPPSAARAVPGAVRPGQAAANRRRRIRAATPVSSENRATCCNSPAPTSRRWDGCRGFGARAASSSGSGRTRCGCRPASTPRRPARDSSCPRRRAARIVAGTAPNAPPTAAANVPRLDPAAGEHRQRLVEGCCLRAPALFPERIGCAARSRIAASARVDRCGVASDLAQPSSTVPASAARGSLRRMPERDRARAARRIAARRSRRDLLRQPHAETLARDACRSASPVADRRFRHACPSQRCASPRTRCFMLRFGPSAAGLASLLPWVRRCDFLGEIREIIGLLEHRSSSRSCEVCVICPAFPTRTTNDPFARASMTMARMQVAPLDSVTG